MSEQGAGGGFDSTVAPGHSRSQPSDETTSTDQTTEVHGSPTPAQRSAANGFASSEQDPRSTTAGAASGTRSPPVTDSPSPSLAYEASQQPCSSLLQQQAIKSRQPTQVQRAQEAIKLEKQRRQQRKLGHSLKPEQQPLCQQQLQQPTRQSKEQEPEPELEPELEQDLDQEMGQEMDQDQDQDGLASQRQHRHSPQHDQQPQQSGRFELPVTKATLSELDVNKIIHNPKLRHDINYDPDLHFRPNLDGEKGRRKQDKANQFWDNLRSDLVEFVTDREAFLQAHGPDDNDWSLPVLLTAVKDIIQTLVPMRDRDMIDEGLNVPLLMQQFARGVMNLENLATWLSSVLKMHCAPMRDDWVDEMYSELSHGNRENDVDELVKGLSSLLSVLEAMKLDVANHQIRCLRPLLIEDTVQFEQRFFYKKIQNRRMSVSAARSWYQRTKSNFANPSVRHRQAFGNMGPFFNGLVDFLLPSVDASQVPNTFLFDEDRIVKLRSDMFDAIHLEVCMKVYEAADTEEIAMQHMANINEEAPTRRLGPDGVPLYLNSQASNDFNFNTAPASPATGSPVSSRPNSLDFSACGSTRNSDIPMSNSDAGAPPEHPEEFADARERSASLYSSLVALLQGVPSTSRPSDRWEELWPVMSVEIYRTLSSVDRRAHLPLDQIEMRLKAALSPDGLTKQHVERIFRERLLSSLARRVTDYKTMANVSLFVVAAGGRINPTSARNYDGTSAAISTAAVAAAAAVAIMARKTRTIDPREDGCVEDMATRLAHLGILHWRVWGQLVYEAQN